MVEEKAEGQEAEEAEGQEAEKAEGQRTEKAEEKKRKFAEADVEEAETELMRELAGRSKKRVRQSVMSQKDGQREGLSRLERPLSYNSKGDDEKVFTKYSAVSTKLQIANGEPVQGYFDSGANCSAISAKYYHESVMANRNFKRKATASNKVVTVGDSYDVWPMGRVNLSARHK